MLFNIKVIAMLGDGSNPDIYDAHKMPTKNVVKKLFIHSDP